MEVVLIKHTAKYDDCEKIIGIALNEKIANEYIEDLAIKYPYVYGKEYGSFSFETYKIIDE